MRAPSRMAAVQSPVIPVIGELIRTHPGTISLGQGVVYYGPPPEAGEALQDFLRPNSAKPAINHFRQLIFRFSRNQVVPLTQRIPYAHSGKTPGN